MSAMRTGVVIGVSGALGACLLFTDLDGLSGAAVVLEASTSDASADGRLDGGDSGEGGFCRTRAPQPTFCDDFDERPLGFDWESSFNNATRAHDPSAFTSPPNAFLVTTTATSEDNTGRQKRRVQATTRVTLTVSVHIDASAPASNAAMFGFEMLSASGGLDIYWSTNDADVFSLVEDLTPTGGTRTFTSHPPVRGPVRGKWARVETALEREGTATRLRATVDGVEALSVLTANPVDFTTLRASIGISYVTPPKAGWAVRYDDVVIDAK